MDTPVPPASSSSSATACSGPPSVEKEDESSSGSGSSDRRQHCGDDADSDHDEAGSPAIVAAAAAAAADNDDDNDEDDDAVLPSDAKPNKTIKDRRRQRQEFFLVLFAGLYTLLFVGAFFGWGPLQLMLEASGSFSGRCTADEQRTQTVCREQTAALVNAHFVASTTQVVAPFLGQILDRHGAIRTVYLMAACIMTGLALLIVAVAFTVDALVYVALIVWSLGTWFGGMLTIQTGCLYFSGKAQHRVIVALNSLFDSGAVTYWGLWAIQDATGARAATVLSGYFGLGVLVLGGGCYFWTVVPPMVEEEEDSEEGAVEDGPSMTTAATTSTTTCDQVNEEAPQPPAEPDDDVLEVTMNSSNAALIRNSENDEESADRMEAVETETATSSTGAPPAYALIRDRTSFQQLTSMPAIMLALYFTIHVTNNQWTMTTTRDFLASLGDDDYNNRYLTIFTLLTPASLIFIPCVDVVLNRYGYSGGFQFVNLLAVSYNLVRVASDNLNVQIVGFLLFSCFRCFLFGIASSFLPTILAPNVNGKAAGLLYAMTGAFGFVNIPVARVTIVRLNGDFFIPNLAWTLLVLPCVVLAWFIGVAVRREERAKKAIRRSTSRSSVATE